MATNAGETSTDYITGRLQEMEKENAQLKRELQAMKEAFEKLQAESRKQIEELTRRLDAVMRAQSNAAPQLVVTNSPPASTVGQKKLEQELAALNPELSEALFGTPKLPFSISIDFPRFDGPVLFTQVRR